MIPVFSHCRSAWLRSWTLWSRNKTLSWCHNRRKHRSLGKGVFCMGEGCALLWPQDRWGRLYFRDGHNGFSHPMCSSVLWSCHTCFKRQNWISLLLNPGWTWRLAHNQQNEADRSDISRLLKLGQKRPHSFPLVLMEHLLPGCFFLESRHHAVASPSHKKRPRASELSGWQSQLNLVCESSQPRH